MLAARFRRVRTRVWVIGAAIVVVVAIAAVAVSIPLFSSASATDAAGGRPNLVTDLGGFSTLWRSDGRNDLHGAVLDKSVLEYNDKLTVWINQHATPAQQFRALQDSEYQTAINNAYDQSMTVSTGLGSLLSRMYVQGRNSGALPLTSALINSTDGTTGEYVDTTTPKMHFSYPRPYLPTDANTNKVAGEDTGCFPTISNGSSLASLRVGKSYADAKGNLDIQQLPVVIDTTHQFSPHDVTLIPGYTGSSTCQGGSFPSGHTTTAYQAGITLATLIPQLAPEILARASENGNDRIVLGVHYPLDIMGGRIDGEAALAARWSDASFRTKVLEPARAELLAYFEKETGHSLSWDIQHETAYNSNPYGGAVMPGGTAQIVTDRASALAVYTQRLTYGFPKSGTGGKAASVPAGAANLLLTTFPKLTNAERTSILAQTEIGSGYPLDGTGTATGSWERLNLAAAMSAKVALAADGTVKVVATGGTAEVVRP